MKQLLQEIKSCTICKSYLPHGTNPVLAAHPESRIAIIGQAPGRIVHETGIPWDDKSGERLREWMGVDEKEFYNDALIALIPMGFCYPGTGKSGDLPPRKECAPQWHKPLFKAMQKLQLSILIGSYAQAYYLGDRRERNLTETVRNYNQYLPEIIVLPHPSPRNNIWLRKNAWFERELLPVLKSRVNIIIREGDDNNSLS